jgi:hypothetical protein
MVTGVWKNVESERGKNLTFTIKKFHISPIRTQLLISFSFYLQCIKTIYQETIIVGLDFCKLNGPMIYRLRKI